MNTARIPDIFPERGRYLYMVSVWLHRRRGVGHVVLALLDADGAACAARGKERIDLTHRPELRDGILLADAHVVRLLRVCVHGAVDRNACGNAAAVERLYLDRAAIVDGRSAQVDQNGRGGVLRHDADAQRAGRRALIGQNQVLERNIQRAVCRGEVDMVLGERRE